MIDIGIGTGKPLYTVIDNMPKNIKRIVGIDIDSKYVKAA